MKDLFLLSGLGADKRVFDFLNLGAYNIHHITWIDPLANESIHQYAGRLCKQIHSTNPILIGVSFGGMMAIEIGKIIKTEKIILISSARTKKDIPFYFKFTGKLKLHHTIPASLMGSNNFVTSWLFGAKTKSEKELLSAILNDTNPQLLRWAIDKIVGWDNVVELQNVIQIHGTNDKILPFKEAAYTIQGGEHLMIVTWANEVSQAIKEIITD